MSAKAIQQSLKKAANPKKATGLKMFFKTAPGQYGAGDIFLGITVPETRIIAKKYKDIDLGEIKKIFYSKIHEERLCALLILVDKFKRGDDKERKDIFNFYIKHAKQVNNWDLVDTSAPTVVGGYLLNQQRKILYTFARSKNLWEKRIAIIATFAFIKQKQYTDTFRIAEILMHDTHDLIHKAVGWMLREVGNRSGSEEEKFLKKHYKKMPRTMLRYAIEKFPEKKRKVYLKK